MKKYIVAGVVAGVGVIIGIATHSGSAQTIGLLIAVVLVIVAAIIAFGKIAFIERLLGDAGYDESGAGSSKSVKTKTKTKKGKYSNPAEEAVETAKEHLNAGHALEAVELLEEAATLVEDSNQYIYFGVQALTILAEFFGTGSYNNSTIRVDEERSI